MDITLIIIFIAVVVMLIAVGVYVGVFCRKLLQVNSEIKTLIGYLQNLKLKIEKSVYPQNFYTANFEDINKEFNKYPAVRLIWQDFSKSLTYHKDDKITQQYSVADASEYFSLRNFSQGMNLSFWQGYGGTFTGLGILGTFVGLTIGLSGIDMTSSDVEVLKSGIAELLSGVQFAFYTSLAGIFIAIIYGVVHNRIVTAFSDNVQTLSELVEEMFPRRTSEYWIHANYIAVKEQANAVRDIAKDMTQAIFDGFDQRINDMVADVSNKIEEKIAPFIEKICNSIDKISTGGVDALGDAMSKIAGSQMQQFADALNNFTDAMQTTTGDFKNATETLNDGVQSLLDKMNEKLQSSAADNAKLQHEAALKFSATVDKLIAAMKDFTDRQQQLLDKSRQDNDEQTQKVVGTLQTGTQNAVDALNKGIELLLAEMRDSLKSIADNTAESQRKSIEANSAEVNRLIAAMKDFTDKQQQLLDKSRQDNDEQTQKVVGTLQTGTQNAVDALNKGIELLLAEMRDSLNNIATDISKLQQESAVKFSDAVDKLIAAMKQSNNNAQAELNAIIKSMRDLANTLQDSLKDYSAESANQMKQATVALESTLNHVQDVLSLMEEAGESFGQTAKPIQQSIALLKETLDKNNSATKQFHEEISAQITGLVAATRNSENEIARLAEYERHLNQIWTNYRNHFENIGSELEKSTQIITERLNEYNAKMDSGMSKTLNDLDNNFAKAVSALHGAIDELNDLLEPLVKKV